MNLMKQLIVKHYLKQQWKSLKQRQLDPAAAQNQAFQTLQASLKSMPAAKALGLHSYSNYTAFVTHRRSTQYEDHAPWIEKQLCGEEALFEGKTSFIGLSSGTTANSKKILYNQRMMQSFARFQTEVASILQEHFGLNPVRDGRLTWGSTPVLGHTPSGIPEGYVSGYLATRAPKLIARHAYPSVPTLFLSDMNQKMKQAAEETKSKDIRFVSGVPSYLISFFEWLRRDLGLENLRKIWPNLSTLVYSGTGITCYRTQLEQLVGAPLNTLGLYASTEGAYGYEIPSFGAGVYCFRLGEIVYGFRDLHTLKLHAIQDLTPGQEVELLITSPNGLTQYATGDALKIKSVSPVITFEVLGRVGQGLNVATEKVSLLQLQKSLSDVCEKECISAHHFFIYPGKSEDGRPCYEWVISSDDEFVCERVAIDLDRALKKQNGDYRENREDLHFLAAPRVHRIQSAVTRQYFSRFSSKGQLKMKSTFESQESYEAFMRDLKLKVQDRRAA